MKKLALTVLLLAISAVAQTATPLTIYKGGSVVSLNSVAATGTGAVVQTMPNSYGDYPMVWTWIQVPQGTPTGVTVNLEGSSSFRINRGGGAITSGAAVLTDNLNCPFVPAMVGDEVQIAGSGAAGATQVSTISTYTNACSVTLAGNAGTTVTAADYSTARWSIFDTSTSTTAEKRHVVYKPDLFLRCNLTTLSGGSSPTEHCRITGF